MESIEHDLSTSVTQINDSLLVSLADEMTDENIAAITDLITTKAYKTNVSGTVLNFTTVTVLDSYLFSAFVTISKTLSLMGVRVVWVGLRPGVVSALVDLNVDMSSLGILTASELKDGLALLSDGRRSQRKGTSL